MPKFRKKPVVIEAHRWFPGVHLNGVITPNIDGFDRSPEPGGGGGGSTQFEPFIHTLEGNHIVRPGDWVVTGIKGEKYNIKDEIFRETYDAVDQEAEEALAISFEKSELPPKYSKYFVFDVESIGLQGVGFAFGYVVIDSFGQELESGFYQCDLNETIGKQEDLEWVRKNVLPHLPDTDRLVHPPRLRSVFWDIWIKHRSEGSELVADCLWPVEARFLIDCIEDDFINRASTAPYPVHELATALLLAGMDPIGQYERLPAELPKHHPTCDARQSARLFWEAMQVIKRSQLSQAIKSS